MKNILVPCHLSHVTLLMSPLVQNFTDLLSFGTVLSDILALALFIILVTPLRKHGWGKAVKEFFGEYAILFSFLVGLGSIIGSLFYSGVANFTPCLLCWIQRGFLYTEAVIFFFALIARKAERVKQYDHILRKVAIILSSIGGLVSLYHVYLQFGGQASINCAAVGASCETVYFIEYGYITIPTMALTAFVLIILFMLCGKKKKEVILG
jgi:disulfide bond formation protein DsbB